jgi:hypothetical protein
MGKNTNKHEHEHKWSFTADDGVNWDTIVPTPVGLPIPTYGNYGGSGYTGGTTDPLQWNYTTAPVDALDALFKLHDRAYDLRVAPVEDRPEADLALIQGIARLPEGQLDAQASIYGGLAIFFSLGQILSSDEPYLLQQNDISRYTREALRDIERGLESASIDELSDLTDWLDGLTPGTDDLPPYLPPEQLLELLVPLLLPSTQTSFDLL